MAFYEKGHVVRETDDPVEIRKYMEDGYVLRPANGVEYTPQEQDYNASETRRAKASKTTAE